MRSSNSLVSVLRPHFLITLCILLGFVVVSFDLPVRALSSDVVISEVYGGGGNTGADFKNDFIELYNHSAGPVNISGWSIQYASAAGTVFQMTMLSGSIPAGGFYLIQQAPGDGGSLDPPTPDATGTIPMSGTSGVVALVTAQIPLVGCGTSCATAPNVKDLVGYGSTANVETAAAPGLTNTTSAARSGSRVDTDNNADDFASGLPTPTNSGIASTATHTPTSTSTNTATNTSTNTPTDTATNTSTNTPTDTATNTAIPPSNTPTDTATNTAIPPSNTPTDTATNTAIVSSNTPTDTATNTVTNIPTATATNTSTNIPTDGPTKTSTSTRTATVTLAVSPSTIPQQKRAFLALVVNGGQADLVGEISLIPQSKQFQAGQPAEIRVTVSNQGNAPSNGFWVDLYINPDIAPTRANQPWDKHCGLQPCAGMAWYVAGLAPGQSITLSSNTLQPGYAAWPGWFVAGTSDLYAYVDSWSPGHNNGYIEERDETNNRAELHGLVVSSASSGLVKARSIPPLAYIFSSAE